MLVIWLLLRSKILSFLCEYKCKRTDLVAMLRPILIRCSSLRVSITSQSSIKDERLDPISQSSIIIVVILVFTLFRNCTKPFIFFSKLTFLNYKEWKSFLFISMNLQMKSEVKYFMFYRLRDSTL